MAGPQDDPDRKRDPLEGMSGFARAMREAGPYLEASWSLMAAVAMGVLAGYFADRKLGTSPWLLLLGAVFGMTAGIYAFIKAVLAAEKKRKSR